MSSVGNELLSRITGYQIVGVNLANSTPNLPQRIAIIGEGNDDFQDTMPVVPTAITSAKQAGELFGYGSPIHMVMRILRPVFSEGVGGIPTIVYPVLSNSNSPEGTNIAGDVSGTATDNATHYIYIAGRNNIDGQFYAIDIVAGDEAEDVATKVADAINNVLGCPITATLDPNGHNFSMDSKWLGLSAADLNVRFDDGGNPAGITYTVQYNSGGAGTPDITDALAAFGDEWNTIVINTLGTGSGLLTQLNTFNGRPDPVSPTGRYAGIVMKPFICLTGTVAEKITSKTDTYPNDVTLAVCPAPLSEGMPFEAAANVAVLLARTAQDTPHLDICGLTYPDMPTPTSIGEMSDYYARDAIMKLGHSTVSLSAGRYKIEDFVTTYHPTGEAIPQFRYCRNLMLDFNICFGYRLLEEQYVTDHVIVNDDDIVTVGKVIKPKQWIAHLADYAVDISKRALTVDPSFMQKNTQVALSTTNPDRLQTKFRYKRSGVARISDTVAEAGFNYGSNN
jgi:phage tail sheath gpL-like